MPELRQLVDGLALGLDALVRSSWGSEASVFTHDVVRELERRGYEVIHILGTTRRAVTQFGALRFSIEDLFRGSSDPITVVDRLSSRILESARPVLVIENADLVDPLSLEVIHDAVERTGCRQVIVLSEVPTADTSALVHPPVQVITLSPPSYAVIEELVRSTATAGISDAWIRRAFVDSGGSPEIVTAILSDPATEDEASDLRTDSVLAVVGSRLSEIPAPLVACLRAISLSPGMTLRDGVDRFGPGTLEPLERSGLVTVSRTEEAIVLGCPPLVAAYFTATSGRIGAPEDGQKPALDRPRDVQHLIRSFELEAREELAEARRRFAEADTPQTRAALAHALWLSDATESALEGVLDDPHGDLDLLVARATWLAVRGHLAEALPLLAPAIDGPGPLGALAAAESLLLEIEYDRVPEDLEARVRRWESEPAASDDVRTILALCCSYAGLLDLADQLLPTEQPESPRQRCRWNLVRGVLTLAREPLADAEAAASTGLAAAVDARDRSGVETFAYLVAMARLLHGDWSGAGSLLAGVRALGHACLFTWPLHRAMRATHAIVLAAEGKETLARALAQESTAMVGSTPIAGVTAPVDDLVTAVLRRDVSGVAEAFAHMSAQARERGYALAEILGTAVTVALEPARALDMELTRERPASWAGWPTFVALVGALAAGDGGSASRQVGALAPDAFQFLGFLTINSALSRLDPDAVPGELRLAADALAARTGAGDAFRPGSGRFGDRISDREREVALLAATLSNAEIARRLGVSKRTIDHHISNALRKTGARTRIELNALVREASVRGVESSRAESTR